VVIENSVLFISADPAGAVKIEAILRGGSEVAFEWHPVETLLDGLRAIQEQSFDLILADLFLPDGHGLLTLQSLKQHAPTTPVVALVHSRDRDTAVTAVRTGAYDFLCYDDTDPSNMRRSFAGALRHAGLEAAKKEAGERRTNTRFSCPMDLIYQTLEPPILSGKGASETLNIGSKGLLFTSNEQLDAGQLVRVALDWPIRLENQVLLKLVAEGRIVRSDNCQTAMTISKYEFRTRRSAAKPIPAANEKQTSIN
jgi:CheY-like chemotaxis protein